MNHKANVEVSEFALVEPLLNCPLCSLEMRLYGIEAENAGRELFTFECEACRSVEVRGARLR